MNVPTAATRPGLRERKKLQTRHLIFEAAAGLFAERGFDAVTVAEVARVADVSEVTVFNHFPTKEDLFFGGMRAFEERIVEAVALRPRGTPALGAVRSLLLEGIERLASDETVATIARSAPILGGSPALRSRQREIVAAYADRLAVLLAAETGSPPGDVQPWVVATALLAVHQAVVARTHAAVLAGVRGEALVAEVRGAAVGGFARLEAGLSRYPARG